MLAEESNIGIKMILLLVPRTVSPFFLRTAPLSGKTSLPKSAALGQNLPTRTA